MASTDDVESYIIKSGLPSEQLENGTWVLRPESAHDAQIGIKLEPPIVLFSLQIHDLSPAIDHLEQLFRLLLELNSELLHVSYSLQTNQVVLSGAQQLENLDFNEFQAMVDDMCMALDNHYDKIAPWVSAPKKASGAEGIA